MENDSARDIAIEIDRLRAEVAALREDIAYDTELGRTVFDEMVDTLRAIAAHLQMLSR